jgi:hypothetical protein
MTNLRSLSFWNALMESSSSTTAKRRFIGNYETYLKGVVEEATDREKKYIRTNIEDYLALRRRTSAVKPSLDLLLLPLEIPNNVLQDPKVKELETLANDMIAVANVSTLHPRSPRTF